MNTLKITFLSFVMALVTIFTVKAQSGLTKPVNTIIRNYLALEDALIGGNATEAEAKAKVLLTSIGEVPKTGLIAGESALLLKLEYDARHISEVNKIAHQREHFASLSNNLYTILKKLKVNDSVLYLQYCTMTKANFLSESDKGKDPYMGMAGCSKVKETLPPVKKQL